MSKLLGKRLKIKKEEKGGKGIQGKKSKFNEKESRTTKRSIRQMDDKAQEYARFADAAYKDESERTHYGNKHLEGWEQVHGGKDTVWVNHEQKRVVHAYRGTVPTDAQDLASDLAISAGTEYKNGRFQNAQRQFDEYYNRYSDYEHNVTGHSLGGSIAAWIYQHNEDRVDDAATFNRGTGVGTFVRDEGEHITHHRINKDPVSQVGGWVGNKNTIDYQVTDDVGLFESHSMSNFLL